MTVWEEDFLSNDRVEYRDDGKLIGEVRRSGGSWQVNAIESGRAMMIAMRPDKKTAMECLVKYVHEVARIRRGLAEANARLIAAAPELLEALKRIRLASRSVPDQFASDLHGDCTLVDCECSNHIARAAIAKAEGTKGESEGHGGRA